MTSPLPQEVPDDFHKTGEYSELKHQQVECKGYDVDDKDGNANNPCQRKAPIIILMLHLFVKPRLK